MNNTLIHNINDIIVSIYFEYLIKDIKRMKKNGFAECIDSILTTEMPNICNNDDELNTLSEFVNDLMKKNKHVSKKDIIIALLVAYYNLTVLEYDDYISYSKLVNHCDIIENVIQIYMGIVGVTYKISNKEIDCCYKPVYKITYYDSNSKLYTKIRRYMLFGNYPV